MGRRGLSFCEMRRPVEGGRGVRRGCSRGLVLVFSLKRDSECSFVWRGVVHGAGSGVGLGLSRGDKIWI